MKSILFVIWFFIYKINCNKFSKHITFISKGNPTNLSGYNEIPHEEDPGLFERICTFYRKKQLLDILQSPHVSQSYKLKIIDTEDFNNYLVPNITRGGLLKDYDFSFDEK